MLPPDEPHLRIATWNIEHLAASDGAGCRPRTEADYAELRTYAASLDADVVAFQEVENAAAARRVFSPDKYVVVMSDRPDGGRRGGVCRENPAQQILKQDVGFAIRKGVPFKRNADLQALGLGDPDLRWGVDVTVGKRQPVRLLAVHLKSGCSAGNTGEACPVLFQQLPVLEGWVDARQREGAAFAVLGDFNRRLDRVGDAFWADLDDGDPAGLDLTTAAAGAKSTCKQRYPEFIDHIALNASAAARVKRFVQFHYGVPEDRHPSDHCPASVVMGSP